ncbi:MAG: LysR family transcriptional regulator [Pseudomonadota bacterium]
MWDEVRVAAEVVRRGTVSAAAESLGFHRATINRRIDALEEYLGGKLFHRHTQGYTPTELGEDLLQIADNAAAGLERLRRRADGQEDAVIGDLIVTSIDGYAPVLLRIIAAFSARYPAINVSYLASNSPLKLELGQAHIAFRVGRRPEELDYVVLPYQPVNMGLYASRSYLERNGAVHSGNVAQQKYVLPKLVLGKDPPDRWLASLGVDPDIALVSDKTTVVEGAIKAGIGIGFFPIMSAESDTSLVEVMPADPCWSVPSWIVTHVDLHRSVKVQALLSFCRETVQT